MTEMTKTQRAILEYRTAYRLHQALVARYGRKECPWDAVRASATALRVAKATALVEMEDSALFGDNAP